MNETNNQSRKPLYVALAFVVMAILLLRGCNLGRTVSQMDVTAQPEQYEETNRAMIHQAGVNAGVNAIMGTGR